MLPTQETSAPLPENVDQMIALLVAAGAPEDAARQNAIEMFRPFDTNGILPEPARAKRDPMVSCWVTKPGRPYKQWSRETFGDPNGWCHPNLSDRYEIVTALPPPAEAVLYEDGPGRWEMAFRLSPEGSEYGGNQYGTAVVRERPFQYFSGGEMHMGFEVEIRMNYHIGVTPGPPLYLVHRLSPYFNRDIAGTEENIRSAITGWMFDMWQDAYNGNKVRHEKARQERDEKKRRLSAELAERCSSVWGVLKELESFASDSRDEVGRDKPRLAVPVFDALVNLVDTLTPLISEYGWIPMAIMSDDRSARITWDLDDWTERSPKPRLAIIAQLKDKGGDEYEWFVSRFNIDLTKRTGTARSHFYTTTNEIRPMVRQWFEAHAAFRGKRREDVYPSVS